VYTRNLFSFVSAFITITYVFVAIFCTVYCFYRLQKSGLAKEVKMMIWRRHIFWTAVFFITNLFPFYANLCSALDRINNTTRLRFDTPVTKSLFWIYAAQGLTVFIHACIVPEYYIVLWHALTGKS